MSPVMTGLCPWSHTRQRVNVGLEMRRHQARVNGELEPDPEGTRWINCFGSWAINAGELRRGTAPIYLRPVS